MAQGGTIRYDVNFSAETADKMVVQGNTTNAGGRIDVNNATPSSTTPITPFKIPVVEVSGNTAEGDFTFPDGSTESSSGKYEYRLLLENKT